MQHILEIKNISKTFPGVKALDNVSLDVVKGHVHGIVGENGAGKSTLMKILSAVYKADKNGGEIIFDGKPMTAKTPAQSMELGLSIIYQEFNLVDLMTVGENIFLGRYKQSGGMKAIHQKARMILDRIGSSIDTHSLVAELSISEKQLVEIAKALSFNSKLIIMDEPSTTLTADEMEKLFALIRDLREQGITIIYISHKLDEIYDLCDRVTIMCDGRVVDTRDTKDISRNELVSKMVGRPIENEFPIRTNHAGKTLLEVRGLCTDKLKDVSFDVKAGEILGLVGLVGSGRTEIVRALFGADRAQSGSFLIDGEKVEIHSPIDAKKAGIGFVTEDRKQQGLFLKFSVEENIIAANVKGISEYGFISEKKSHATAQNYVKDLAIKAPKLSTKVLSLSGGNQQKCIIARWLEVHPRILILDEPTRGIDVGAKYEIYLLIRKLAEQGNAVILISSELPEVLNLSNRCLTVSDGRIVGEYDPAVSSAEEIMGSVLK